MPSLQSLLVTPTERLHHLKRILADLLKICVEFLKHPYIQVEPSAINHRLLISDIISKEPTIEKQRHLAVSIAGQLRLSNFEAFRSAQEQARLRSASHGIGWYALQRALILRQPLEASDLDRAMLGRCVELLHCMYEMHWSIIRT